MGQLIGQGHYTKYHQCGFLGNGVVGLVGKKVEAKTNANFSTSSIEEMVGLLGIDFDIPSSDSSQKYPILLWEK